MIDDDRELRVAEHDGMAMVTLNRPQALNALTLEMIRILGAGLTKWEHAHKIRAVVFNGAGLRAFCAGGDIKAAYNAGMSFRRGDTDERLMSIYYGEEYQMNRRLFHYRKPLIAFMDGITMGGGFGVAGPCRFRVATEKTVFAMPEVGIGFFPDVGSVYYLNSCPGSTGAYLAVTGGSVGPADMLYTGLATHYMPSSSLMECEDALCQAMGHIKEAAAQEKVSEILDSFSIEPPPPGIIEQNRAAIDKCFSHDSIRGILETLGWEESDWARETIATINSRSPISLIVSLMHLRHAAGQDFDTVIDRDFILAQHFLKGHDFYEGVRAVVIDKDRNPKWDPSHIDDITDKEIARYFSHAMRSLDEFAI